VAGAQSRRGWQDLESAQSAGARPDTTGRSDHQTLRRCSLQCAALPKALSGHVSWRSSMLTITRSIQAPGHSKDSLALPCCQRARVRTRGFGHLQVFILCLNGQWVSLVGRTAERVARQVAE
jgi:hypothetical protein